jgi:DNA-binding response OmpR family regulator
MHMRVLIVDDYPDTAEATGELLASAGHEYRAATCGADALTEADAFDPELAIVDIGLPDIDGCALLGALRSRLATRPPYLVAMTGWQHAFERAVEAGFDECLLKPAGREQLLRVVELARRRRASS